MKNIALQLLQEMPIFGGISDSVLEFLLQSVPVISIPKGDYFFCEGDQALSMFVLEEGEVAVLKLWNNRHYRLTRMKKGDCFGEMALIGLFPRTASVRATDDCVAIELSSAALFDLYERDLEQFAVIQMNIARELSRRLSIADERLFQALAEAELAEQRLSILT